MGLFETVWEKAQSITGGDSFASTVFLGLVIGLVIMRMVGKLTKRKTIYRGEKKSGIFHGVF